MPEKMNAIGREHRDMLQLVTRYGSRTTPSTVCDHAIQLHTCLYEWIPVLDIVDRSWGRDHFRDEFDALSTKKARNELMILRRAAVDFEKEWKKFFHAHRWSARDRQFFNMNRKVTFYKDDRDEVRRKAYFYVRNLYIEIARRLAVTLPELMLFTDDEIMDAMKKGKINTRALAAREKFFYLNLRGNRVKVITGIRAHTLADALKQPTRGSEQWIKGIVASSGLVHGRAVVVRSKTDLAKVKTGDIMIAITTHPDFVSAMRLASAIVTDEGGMVSHAAIIARELKTPCIVGTKVATQVFKDNDMIEVDAEKGIVKKL